MELQEAKENIEKKGFLDISVGDDIDYASEIKRLKKEKNAVILAHYYQEPAIQDIADFVGDSLQLSYKAAEADADLIVFAGVHFMAETAKILNPDKKVVLPDLNAGCSLSEACEAEDLAAFKKKHPDHLVVTYVNTSAAVKAISDICCTSSNAKKIIDSIPEDQPIIFAPDKTWEPISTKLQVGICCYGKEPVLCTKLFPLTNFLLPIRSIPRPRSLLIPNRRNIY